LRQSSAEVEVSRERDCWFCLCIGNVDDEGGSSTDVEWWWTVIWVVTVRSDSKALLKNSGIVCENSK